MNGPLSDAPASAPPDSMRPMRIAAARAWQSLGWPGAAGSALTLAALAMAAVAWRVDSPPPLAAPTASDVRAPAVRAEPTATAIAAAPAGSRRGDVPLLLGRIAEAASASGLGWPAADYRVAPATADRPATLEVRCTLKGGYPALRRMLAQVLSTVPAATLRELSMSRAGSDVAEVEAKLGFVVFLGDDDETEASPPEALR